MRLIHSLPYINLISRISHISTLRSPTKVKQLQLLGELYLLARGAIAAFSELSNFSGIA